MKVALIIIIQLMITLSVMADTFMVVSKGRIEGYGEPWHDLPGMTVYPCTDCGPIDMVFAGKQACGEHLQYVASVSGDGNWCYLRIEGNYCYANSFVLMGPYAGVGCSSSIWFYEWYVFKVNCPAGQMPSPINGECVDPPPCTGEQCEPGSPPEKNLGGCSEGPSPYVSNGSE